MKLKEFFTYLNPYECISIADDAGWLVVKPVEYQNLKYSSVSDSLDANVIQVHYDHEDNSLTITIAFDD